MHFYSNQRNYYKHSSIDDPAHYISWAESYEITIHRLLIALFLIFIVSCWSFLTIWLWLTAFIFRHFIWSLVHRVFFYFGSNLSRYWNGRENLFLLETWLFVFYVCWLILNVDGACSGGNNSDQVNVLRVLDNNS